MVSELEALAAMHESRRKGVGGDARRLVAHQLFLFQAEQFRVGRFRLAPPVVEGRQGDDALWNFSVVEGVYEFVIDQHIGPPRLVFQRLDLLHELGVVLEEAPLPDPVLADLACDQRLAEQDFARQFRIARTVVHAPLGMDHQAVQRDALPGHDMLADQVGADLLQPFRLDLGDAAREQARSLDDLGGDDPAPGLLQQAGTRMDVEADAACAEVVLVFLDDEADVAEQAGQQGLVDGLVTCRNLVLAP